MKGFKADNSHICTAEHVQVKYCYNQTVVRDTFFWSCKIVIIKIMRFLGLVKPKEFCHVKLDIYLTRHKFCNEGFRMNDSEWLLTSYHLGQLCLTLNDVRWKMMLENCNGFTALFLWTISRIRRIWPQQLVWQRHVLVLAHVRTQPKYALHCCDIRKKKRKSFFWSFQKQNVLHFPAFTGMPF